MRRLGRLLAIGFVKARLLVVGAWIAGAVWMALALPSITTSSGSSLGQLVPQHAPALKAEELSVRHFSFPLLSETMIVVRNPHGLSTQRQLALVSLAKKIDQHRLPGFAPLAGALPLTNTIGYAPFAREHGTTALLYLFFPASVDSYVQSVTAHHLLASEIGHRSGEYAGVTGEAPGQVARTTLINRYLKWVMLATILVVALAIGLHFRAPGAAALTVGAVGVAYVVADRVVAQFGRLGGISVPSQVQPVLVVLVFGVVTDYSVFFMSRFRRLLAEGIDRRDAAIRVVREITPIVAVAGITVAAGTAGLLAARLDFLRAFGPGLAISVVVAMLVAATLVPAALGLFGAAVFWPRLSTLKRQAERSQPGWWQRIRGRLSAVRLAVRHPILGGLVAVAIVAAAASGLFRIRLGNELILGLPSGSQARAAYMQAKHGFAPGVLGPSVVLVTGSGLGAQQPALGRLQHLLRQQPDVVQVFGPGQQVLSGASPSRPGATQIPTSGITVSRDGDAARFAVFLGSDPLGPRAITDIERLNGRLPALLRQAGLHGATGAIAGNTALSSDSVHDTLGDLGRVTPVVLLSIFVVIALFLRALVAPGYLILTSVLAALAALGLAVYVVQDLIGYGQIAYYVVFTVAVLLVSLGSDYNVFLIGRVWQEGRRRGLKEAVERAGVRASRPITTAGAVLAASFAVLAIVPVASFREVAFGMAAGLIIDAFVVRTMLVPALISLVGSVSAWPSRRLRRIPRPPSEAPATPSPGG